MKIISNYKSSLAIAKNIAYIRTRNSNVDRRRG